MKTKSHKKWRHNANQILTMKVNGSKTTLNVKSKLLLSEFLRDVLGYTSVKTGCETGNCGACTALVKFKDEKYVAVKSCSLFAVQCNEGEVTTVEGLTHEGELSPIQTLFLQERGLQCGYCTPGFIMAAIGLLLRRPNPSLSEIKHELSGNLCRCGAYPGILNAVKMASEERIIKKLSLA